MGGEEAMWTLRGEEIKLSFYIHVTCVVIDFFLNNQPDALIIQFYSVIKLYTFRASSLPIIRSFLLFIGHWQVSCRFLMTASKQSQDGTFGEKGTACDQLSFLRRFIRVVLNCVFIKTHSYTTNTQVF
jgi:hypothetical protein